MLKEKVPGLFLKLARFRFIQRLIVFTLIYMNQLLPINRIYEDDQWIAFQHPQPLAPLHIVILSKKALKSLMELSDDDAAILTDLVVVAKKLIAQFNLVDYGYRLINNGGSYQTFPQLHWHLLSEDYPENLVEEAKSIL